MTEPTLPTELQGVWRRVSIAVGDAPPVEEQVVVWLQGPTAFADVRVPLDPRGPATATSFAGTTTFVPPHLTWHRQVDLDIAGDADIGQVEWDGDDLVERGTFPFFGAPVAYEEVWRRTPTSGPMLALEAPGARLLRIGAHAITVIDCRPDGGCFSACHRTLGPSGWDVLHGFGPAYHLLPGPPLGEAWEAADEVVLPRRGAGAPASWRVVEAGMHDGVSPPAEAIP